MLHTVTYASTRQLTGQILFGVLIHHQVLVIIENRVLKNEQLKKHRNISGALREGP